MKILNTTTPHYTRCIKPNRGCRPLTFKKKEVFYPIRLCPLLTKNVSFYRCFLFFFFIFFISFVRFLCNWQPVGLWRPFTSVLPAFQSGIKYYVFYFGVFFCYFFVFCWLVTTSVRQNSFQKLRTALWTEGKTFRFQVFFAVSLSVRFWPADNGQIFIIPRSLFAPCLFSFSFLHPFSKLYSHFLTLPGLFRFGLLKQEFLVMFSTSMKL